MVLNFKTKTSSILISSSLPWNGKWKIFEIFLFVYYLNTLQILVYETVYQFPVTFHFLFPPCPTYMYTLADPSHTFHLGGHFLFSNNVSGIFTLPYTSSVSNTSAGVLHFHWYLNFCLAFLFSITGINIFTKTSFFLQSDLHFHLDPKISTPTYISVFQLALGADTLHQVEEEFTGHGLDAAGEGLVVDILGEQTDCHRQLLQGQGLPHMVDQIR